MSRRKLPPSSKKSVSRVTGHAIARREEALDENEVPTPATAEAPTGPVLAIVAEPPVVDVASEMTARMVHDVPERLLAPDEIVPRDEASLAPPPRRAPPGDCRSMRRGALFALVYRHGTALVMRTGTAGSYGVWRVVDYPTTASASRAYAREVALLADDGYVDVG